MTSMRHSTRKTVEKRKSRSAKNSGSATGTGPSNVESPEPTVCGSTGNTPGSGGVSVALVPKQQTDIVLYTQGLSRTERRRIEEHVREVDP
jgi:hypothetical protein